ncbi:MAG: hypothetical protein CME62_15940 [Halobacteriovoraceae bacterium]|nr:hypothetical protein [Halobacteriovoraceae bacterium]|tara:strand:+ start:6081 stop:7331 length:1251 start_codon:yes stop_codon:yes gene_type:complete
MANLGFGGYRISIKSEQHREALVHALDNGIKLIDTSTNYTDGESEKLIGEVLKNQSNKPLVVSKVGYIQGENLVVISELNAAGIAKEDLVVLDENLKHSIHPEFIEDQIKRSLDRLQLKQLDSFLLHNPEYYLKTEGSTQEEYYRRIALAFNKMEELVERGLIKSYGISSNTFVLPRQEHEATDLDTVYNIAKKLKDDHHFKYIQFPMNMLEMGALERQYEGEHLIERAHSYGLKTMINRPLNSFSDHGLLRLATYQVDEDLYQPENADDLFNKCIQPLVIKWLEVREDEQDKLFDIPLMQQVSKIWHQQHSLDAVDQVFMGYFFPLVANIWGKDLSASESQSFYELYEHAREFAKLNMNSRAKQFEEQATNSGLLFESDKSLSQKVIAKYETFGVDYILVGMRDKKYVDDLEEFI